jgi:hypothetical protein
MVHVVEFLANWTGDPLALTCKGHEVTVHPGTRTADQPLFQLAQRMRRGRLGDQALAVTLWLGVSVGRAPGLGLRR